MKSQAGGGEVGRAEQEASTPGGGCISGPRPLASLGRRGAVVAVRWETTHGREGQEKYLASLVLPAPIFCQCPPLAESNWKPLGTEPGEVACGRRARPECEGQEEQARPALPD